MSKCAYCASTLTYSYISLFRYDQVLPIIFVVFSGIMLLLVLLVVLLLSSKPSHRHSSHGCLVNGVLSRADGSMRPTAAPMSWCRTQSLATMAVMAMEMVVINPLVVAAAAAVAVTAL